MTAHEQSTPLQRIPTRVPGLDEILRGGLLEGGVYIVRGSPGTGKTILANQICFRHAASGGCAIFVTLLSETHSRMLQHLRTLSFFDESLIPERLYYVSGYAALQNEGLKGVLDLLRREIRSYKGTLLVMDGLGTAALAATSEREFKKFVHDVQSHAQASGCTVLLIKSVQAGAVGPEDTMVDGVVELVDNMYFQRRERSLCLHKFRGSGFLRGAHAYRITVDGVVVFPRIEAAFPAPSLADDYEPRRVSSGVKGLDALLRGGLLAQTTTGVFGPTGSGKTTLGIQYVASSTTEERGLFFGFYEHPQRLRARAKVMGIDLGALEEQGLVEIIWRPQGEQILDELGYQILEAVRRRGVRRLFVDGFDGLTQSAVHPERITRFASALWNELRARDVTGIISMEMRDVMGSAMELPAGGMSSLLEALIIMRYTEVEGRIQRLISITKIRDSGFDPFLHELAITETGIVVGEPFTGFEAMLSGHGRRPRAPSPGGSRKRGRKE